MGDWACARTFFITWARGIWGVTSGMWATAGSGCGGENGPADEFDAERSEILTTGSTEDTGGILGVISGSDGGRRRFIEGGLAVNNALKTMQLSQR